MTDTIFQFKVTLNDSRPKVWRRILVPADYTFFDLHCAIQNAMGWTDSHLHAFYLGERMNKDRITIEYPNPEGDDVFQKEARDERQENIADYFNKTIKQCVYCYDFGDNWNHTVLLEKILPKELKTKYPLCLAGENACPPEDCGGIGGYEDLQEILKNPNHSEHKEMLEWLDLDDPDEFTPNEFEPSEVAFENPKKRLKEWNEGFGLI